MATIQFDFVEIIDYLFGLKTQLTSIERKVDQLIMEEKQVADLLTQIDANTNTNATVVGKCSDAVGVIKTELEAWIAKAGQSGVSQALIDQATALKAKTDTVVTALNTVEASLESVAAEGAPTAGNPPPPPPPTL